MKKIIATSVICFSLLLISQSAFAQQSGIGVGAVINGPTGLSYKAWIADDVAVAGAVTFSFGDGIDQFYTHADVLLHNDTVLDGINPQNAYFSVYYGGGVSLNFFNDPAFEEIAIRVPAGLNYGLIEAPLEAFFELAPTIQFIDNTRFYFSGALGFRYYLN